VIFTSQIGDIGGYTTSRTLVNHQKCEIGGIKKLGSTVKCPINFYTLKK
jgi:hypothetical protein